MIYAGKLATWCFLLGASSILMYSVVNILFWTDDVVSARGYYVFFFVAAHYVVVNALICGLLREFDFQVGVRALMLGTVFACGFFTWSFAPSTYTIFGIYACVLSFFHFSEFVAISACNPETLAISSFVLDHSLDYKVAAVASWVEFFVERYFWPEMKTVRIIPTIGLIWCIGGEALRKIAMVTASRSFTHVVASTKAEHHILITHGVYSFFRHPSYVGWFFWAIGTQLILANPLCIVAYTLASWKFMNDRITVEELTLLRFFGESYIDYQKKVPIGLPFMKGYSLED